MDAPKGTTLNRLLSPILSPEHGAHVVLGASFAIGVIAAGRWNAATTVALVAVAGAHLAQYPAMFMLRKRAFTARHALWAAIYVGVAIGAGSWVVTAAPALMRLVTIVAAVFGLSAWLGAAKHYKSLAQELIVFAALPLAAAWAETATRGYMLRETVGVWVVLAMAFWGAVFAVRIRSRGSGARTAALVYTVALLAATALVVTGTIGGPIAPAHAWLLGPSVLRLAVVLSFGDWWMGLQIRTVGIVESAVAVAMVAVTPLAT